MGGERSQGRAAWGFSLAAQGQGCPRKLRGNRADGRRGAFTSRGIHPLHWHFAQGIWRGVKRRVLTTGAIAQPGAARSAGGRCAIVGWKKKHRVREMCLRLQQC